MNKATELQIVLDKIKVIISGAEQIKLEQIDVYEKCNKCNSVIKGILDIIKEHQI